MASTVQLIDLLGAGALLIWGLRLIKTGILRAFGASLRQWIRRGTGNRVNAAFAGLLATIAMQSSTATAVVTASFASRGLINPKMGQAVMLGANVGTAIAALVLSLDVHWFGSAMILVGVAISTRSKLAAGKGIGRALLGLGLMLVALRLMANVTEPMRNSEVVIDLLAALGEAPVLAVIFAALLAFISSSSLAVVLFASLLFQGGVISALLVVFLVAGANLGGAVPPWLAVFNDGPEARRLATANLIVRAIGSVALMLVAAPFVRAMEGILPDIDMIAVAIHLIFNVALLLVFLPVIGPIYHLAGMLLPKAKTSESSGSYLDESALTTPALALVGAAREALKVGDLVKQMLEASLRGLISNDPELRVHLSTLEDQVDASQEAIKFYLAKLNPAELDDEDRLRSDEIVSYAINLEHAGDIIHIGLCELAMKKSAGHLSFSSEGLAELRALFEKTLENLQLSQSVFLTRDEDLATRLALAKVEVRRLEAESSTQHLQRVRERRSEALETSSLHLDMLRDLKRINAHFASVAASVLEQTGHTTSSRLLSLPDRTAP
ncbi:Na/Pi cotransporter family protein [Devosia sp. Root635]|uniref:Na/Pi cotransporter family protein n=1 Tax=Devosia sp. Root635 TaxID=1736575 RepID=UPI0006F987CE|nr:Na/Pi cotransporter family protein [Devosia sp. Root635]KRA43189.1 sodium:phosphate symporter [Devosia sp. Root635]